MDMSEITSTSTLLCGMYFVGMAATHLVDALECNGLGRVGCLLSFAGLASLAAVVLRAWWSAVP